MKVETRNCQNCKADFIIESEDFGFYQKMKVPPPTFCPDCRMQRRHAWKNETSLYNSKCGLCNKSVITIYSPESGINIYCVKCWWSDKWDPKSYAQDYDFSRPFFEQFQELNLKVPHLALINDDGIASVNCEYTQDFAFGKNCYMVFIAWHLENVMYSYFILAGKDIMDCMNLRSQNEFIYECFFCSSSYRLIHSQVCKACIDCAFLFNCINCQDCLMCFGLQGKKYYYKNQPYSKEEYEKILSSYNLHTHSGIEKAKKEFNEFITNYPRRYAYNFHIQNCVGEMITHCKNVKYFFIGTRSENSRYCDLVEKIKDSYDLAGGGEISESYESVTSDQSSGNLFGLYSWKNQDVKYTQHCHNSKNTFGCVSMRNVKYCILNKQYTKEEYEMMLPKIIKHMNEMPYIDKKGMHYKYGEFYPSELSPFGYNETVAQVNFPLSKDEVLRQGLKWQDSFQFTTGKETLTIQNILDSINDIGDDILDQVLACETCNRNYKIVPNELIFYRKLNIPIPRKCFYCRHANRLKKKNPFKLWHRGCMCNKANHFHGAGKCEVEFETSYSPDRPEVVYCEKCYQQEIF